MDNAMTKLMSTSFENETNKFLADNLHNALPHCEPAKFEEDTKEVPITNLTCLGTCIKIRWSRVKASKRWVSTLLESIEVFFQFCQAWSNSSETLLM
jgi:hypothetical protein